VLDFILFLDLYQSGDIKLDVEGRISAYLNIACAESIEENDK